MIDLIEAANDIVGEHTGLRTSLPDSDLLHMHLALAGMHFSCYYDHHY